MASPVRSILYEQERRACNSNRKCKVMYRQVETLERDVFPGLVSLLRLCEQSRTYCAIAREKIDDESLRDLLCKTVRERDSIIMDLSRYLRSCGQDPGEYFSTVFHRQQSRKKEEEGLKRETPEDDHIICSIYVNEEEMLNALNDVKGEIDDPVIRAHVAHAATQACELKDALSLYLEGHRKRA